MTVLGIETSCDETAAAVVRDGREVLSNVVYTQIPLHRPYGGVVPEVASRAHVEKVGEVVRTALERANSPVDAVAVTYGPGLAPALLVGLHAAKGLAASLRVPLIGVNHLEAHLHSPFLFETGASPLLPPPEALMPALGLVVSGGNTIWVRMDAYGQYEVMGETLDDAAGEAFDKAAKALGLGYPGGLKIDRISAAWTGDFLPFPKGRPREGVSALAGLPADLCVSFSGLKTALLRYIERHREILPPASPVRDFGGYLVSEGVAQVVASYQEAIAEALAERTRTALSRAAFKAVVFGGGVSLNSRIRAKLADVCRERGVALCLAKGAYTGDNAAMVAGLAAYPFARACSAADLDVDPSLAIGSRPQGGRGA